MAARHAAAILEYFADPDAVALNARDLAATLGIKKAQWSPFQAAIETLIEARKLRRTKDGRLGRPRPLPKLTGKIKRTTSGAGYFTPDPVEDETDESASHAAEPRSPDEDPRIYIAPEDLGGAMTGDQVEIMLVNRRRSGGQRMGRITSIVTRARTQFVGTYFEREEQGFVAVDGGVMEGPISVGDPGAKGARPKDKVLIEVLKFATDTEPGEAVLTQVLGPHGAPGVDTLSIIAEFQLPDAFPEAVLEEAREVVRAFDEHDLSHRVDLTGETIITIDPVDARDFDDAISLEEDDRGYWRLGVHIADVSHFVVEGSVLDQEARKRGTSVYLPDRVLPMIPELISNGLASLQQGHIRFTKTAFIDFDPQGVMVGTEFANSAIKVAHRFAYEQVMPILSGEPPATPLPPRVLPLLQRMHRLAMLLRKRRFDKGALDLQLPEVKIDMNVEGRVNGAHRVSHDESHQIIEEFMLAANIAVASRLSQLQIPYLHRVHDMPDERKLRALGDFLKGLGFDVKPWVGRLELKKLLDEVRGHPAEQAISYALLRSLKQAEYSPAEVGHFALAEEFYCHFTSPIRRYPDLHIHRLFDRLVKQGRKIKMPSLQVLAKLGEHCSETERRAQNAERELIKVKMLEYLKDKVGWQMDALITSVEKFGLFCQGIELPADGLVHLRNLPEDRYDYDAKSHTLIGRRADRMFRLGDRVRVEVLKVDTHQRTLDFKLLPEKTDKTRRHGAPAKRSPPPGRKRKGGPRG